MLSAFVFLFMAFPRGRDVDGCFLIKLSGSAGGVSLDRFMLGIIKLIARTLPLMGRSVS